MRTVLIRLAEMLALCCITSSISCAVNYFNIIPSTDEAFFLVLAVALLIFVVENFFMLRACFWENPVLSTYYLFNFAAYGILVLISLLVYKFGGKVPYAWLFGTFKLVTYSSLDFPALKSSALIHLAMLILIGITPLFSGIPILHKKIKKGGE